MNWLLVIVFILVFVTEIGAKNRYILYLNSYHAGFSWSDDESKGIHDYFSKYDSIAINTEFINAKRQTYSEIENWFLPYMQKKHKGIKYDVVVASDNAALDFVLKHRADLNLNKVPIVFCGISNYNSYPLVASNLFGVYESSGISLAFELVPKIFPQCKKIHMFIDRTSSGESYKNEAKNIIEKTKKLELVIHDSTYIRDLEVLLRTLGKDDLIFYQGIHVDGAGEPVNHFVYYNQLVKYAKSPILSNYITYKEGAIGGLFIDGYVHGTQCAEIADKILKKALIKKRVWNARISSHFDYNKIVEYDLNIEFLPENTLFMNLPTSIWAKYKYVIVLNGLLLLVLFFGILMLYKHSVTQDRLKKVMATAFEKAKESDSLKGAFLANVSHELRTPLNAIFGFTDLLKAEIDNNQVIEYLDMIHNNSELLTSLVNDLLEISLIDANAIVLNPSTVDLNDFFNKLNTFTVDMLVAKRKTDIDIIIKHNKAYASIITDPKRLEQIMHNFIENAIKYTQSGSITIGVEHAVVYSQQFGLSPQNESTLAFFVEDTGIGIDKANLKMVFERFRVGQNTFVSQHGGFGLGLNISQSLTHLLGGETFVISEIKKGSIFGVFLPLS